MYEETKSSIDWKGLFLKVIIAFLILFIAFKGYSLLKGNKVNDKTETTSSATSNSASSTTFASNMEKLKAAGNTYFKGDKLPSSSAPTIVTLNELKNNGLIEDLVDEDGKTCDGESSYVTATLENNQYKIKANLVCGSSSSYTLVYMGNDTSNTSTSTSTSTSNSSSYSKKASGTTTSTCTTSNCGKTVSVSTNTKVNQTVTVGNGTKTNNTSSNNNIRYYTVTFDSNGGIYSFANKNVRENYTVENPGYNLKNACSFKGWYLNGTKYDFNTPVTRNITLVANYSCTNNNYSDYYNNNSNYDYDNNYYKRTTTDTTTTSVYTMGWSTRGTNDVTIEHTLRLPSRLDKNTIKNVRIKSVKYNRALTKYNDMKDFYNKHSDTFIYNNNEWDARGYTTDSLATISRDAVSFYIYNSDNWKSRYDAETDGFRVRWNANYVSNQCAIPMSVNNVSNLCNYGIVYDVTWEYQIYE